MENKKREEKEAKQAALKKKEQEMEKKKILKEISEMKLKQTREEAKRIVDEMEKEVAKKAMVEKQKQERQKREEKERQANVDIEKKRLWNIEMEKQRMQDEQDRHQQKEENRKITREILERREKEEQERKIAQKQNEEEKSKLIEKEKKIALEEKKRKLFEKNTKEDPFILERPKKKSINNPLAQKFEEIAKNAEIEEKFKKEINEKKNKLKEKSKIFIKKSRQNLKMISKSNLRSSQTFKQSKESLLKKSIEKLKRSKENIQKSKTCIHVSTDKSCGVSKKNMQNYLISQVLFDGDEEVSSSRLRLQERENKQKELEMIKRELEVKKQIEEELRKIKKAEDANKIKQQEAHFESYKKDMEKYLSFVCEDNEKVKKRPQKPKRKDIEERKLKLNIKDIKNQFEESVKESCSSPDPTFVPVVNKLDPNKFLQNTENKDQKKKKEYIPVIIDKAAFERTVGVFEKERQEEEERKMNEERLRKRRTEMVKEKHRLIEEKKRIQIEEEAKLNILQEISNQKMLERETLAEKSFKNIDGGDDSVVEEEEELEHEDQEIEQTQIKNIQEQIRLELEKIQYEEAKQSEKIQKENKRRELTRKIQEEIEKINSCGTPKEEETPAWIKMIMKQKEKESKISFHPLDNTEETGSLKEVVELDTPKWIQIFQEKSKRLEDLQRKQVPSSSPITLKEEVKAKENIMGFKQEKSKSAVLSHLPTIKDIPAEKGTTMRSKSSNVKDRVRKVKSLILDSEPKVTKEKIKVEKDKANKIKKLFESKPIKTKKEVKQPKQKIVQVPFIEVHPKTPTKLEKEWKWKSKNSSELYEFINENKEYVPETLTKRAETNLKTEENYVPEVSEDQFEEYIDDLHTYLKEEDNNECETVFKETILAYLDLIDDKPIDIDKVKSKQKSSLEPGKLKNMVKQLETLQKEENPLKDMQVGKIDASFLNRTENQRMEHQYVSTDVCSNLKSKYETLSTVEDGPKPLYSMKRKIIPVADNIDSMSWKKQHTEYQWKYKQKDISELHNFINNSAKSEKILNQTPSKQYIPTLPKIDFASRLADEEKKMEEFETFMEGIHSYLEEETCDLTESDFKWKIHSYLDLINDEPDTKKNKLVGNKLDNVFQSELPNTKKIMQKLAENVKGKEKIFDVKVGKVNTNFLDKQMPLSVKNKNIPEIKQNLASTLINSFESEETEQEFEKNVVKRKIVQSFCEQENEIQPEVVKKDWKYKQKTLMELNSFIKTNKDMVPNFDKKEKLCTQLCSNDLINKTKKLQENMKHKEDEFEVFMNDLEHFSNKSSSNKEEKIFKKELKEYLGFRAENKNIVLPHIETPFKLADIQSRLAESSNKSLPKPSNKTAIGKVSTFFKKSTKESCNNAKIMKENIESLLQPGKTKLLKSSFEAKPNLRRSVSAIEIVPGRLNVNKFVSPPQPEEKKILHRERQHIFQSKEEKKYMPSSISTTKEFKQKDSLTVSKENSVWSDIEDPEERKNAILAKYGFKPAKNKLENEEDSDIEDYLNYEHGSEIADYEEQLKAQYSLLDYNSSKESSPERETNKTGSLSSLLNILKSMRKSNVTRKFSDSKSRVEDFSISSQQFSKSEVDVSEISGSCSNIKGLFESGKAYSSGRRYSTIDDDPLIKEVKASKKKSDWEFFLKDRFKVPLKSEKKIDVDLPSVKDFKSMFDAGQINSSSIHEYIENRSVASNTSRDNKQNNQELAEEEFDGSQPVKSELEALRRSTKMKKFSRIERGSSSSNEPARGLR